MTCSEYRRHLRLLICLKCKPKSTLTCALVKLEDVGVLEELGMIDADSDKSGPVADEVLGVEGLQHGGLVLADLQRILL
jgi:hypothetical protein